MKLRVVIVDDEPLARQRLALMLARSELAEVVGEADNAARAAAAIAALDPDVVLLDVRMPGETGVELARRLGARPVVVFTTAHGEHAVDAFDTAAADYLMKPVGADKLARALDRAAARLAKSGGEAEPRITARAGDTVRVFAASQIARFRADTKYTVFAIDGVEHLLDESLDTLEAQLAAWGFVRVHRGELVQVSQIRTLRGSELELADGQRVRVSRRMLAQVKKRLGP